MCVISMMLCISLYMYTPEYIYLYTLIPLHTGIHNRQHTALRYTTGNTTHWTLEYTTLTQHTGIHNITEHTALGYTTDSTLGHTT